MNYRNPLKTLIFFFLFIGVIDLANGVHSKHFSIGERLEYEAKFGFLNLGTMILKIVDTTTINGKQCYHITSILISNPALKHLFTLNDTINVYTTTNGLLPVFYEKRIHEGNYSNYQKFIFIQDSLYVLFNDSLKIKVTQPVMDLLSLWYYLRQIPLIEDDTIALHIFEAKKEHRIECRVGKKETIKTPLGRFSTIRITPKTSGKGVFGAGGSMDIWYTNDKNRFPVQIKTKLKFGTVLFKLKGVDD